MKKKYKITWNKVKDKDDIEVYKVNEVNVYIEGKNNYWSIGLYSINHKGIKLITKETKLNKNYTYSFFTYKTLKEAKKEVNRMLNNKKVFLDVEVIKKRF